MPLYEYECAKCGRHTEKIEKVSGPHLKKCPHCGGKVERMISRTSMQFKGSGWYVTDYAGKSGKSDSDSAASSGASAPSGESKDTAAKDSSTKDSGSKDSGAKETKKVEDKKPAKKK